MKSDYAHIADDLKCCVIVPTYNNDGTLKKVLDGILQFTNHVIVVNDGSTDQTGTILKNYPELVVITVSPNKGKGKALQEGFKKALSLDYNYAVTIDSDGQHRPEDLPKFLDALKDKPGSLFVGARNMDQDGIPGKSSFGHRFSNFWYRVETGIKLPDTQSGYRLYPIGRLKDMKFLTPKFEFEIEVLVRAAWKGIPVMSVPVNVLYTEERVSHFRPFRDFFRISVLNTILVLLAWLWFRPFNFFRFMTLDKIKVLIGTKEATLKIALAIGFGIFMGIIPIWGFQMIVAGILAHFLRLNKALVLVASNISIPVMMPLIIWGSFLAGRVFVEDPVRLSLNPELSLENIKTGTIQYVSGAVLLALIAGLVAFITSYTIISIKRNLHQNLQTR